MATRLDGSQITFRNKTQLHTGQYNYIRKMRQYLILKKQMKLIL